MNGASVFVLDSNEEEFTTNVGIPPKRCFGSLHVAYSTETLADQIQRNKNPRKIVVVTNKNRQILVYAQLRARLTVMS